MSLFTWVFGKLIDRVEWLFMTLYQRAEPNLSFLREPAMALELRRADRADAAACAAIVNNWIDATCWLPRAHSREKIEEMIGAGIAMREFWVAGDPVVGYLSFKAEASQIMGLYTARPGSGIGKALMDRVKVGRTWLQLWSHTANARAHAFYRREGFIEVGRKSSGEDGIPEICMEWHGDG